MGAGRGAGAGSGWATQLHGVHRGSIMSAFCRTPCAVQVTSGDCCRSRLGSRSRSRVSVKNFVSCEIWSGRLLR